MGSDTPFSRRPRRSRYISIPAPRMGSDMVVIIYMVLMVYFNPRSPHGERHTSNLPKNNPISIPAPRMGSDSCISLSTIKFAISIPAPRMGSDEDRLLGLYRQLISIPAPRMGSDVADFGREQTKQAFQSPLPAWGATSTAASSTLCPHNFNPRSPHGERHKLFHFKDGLM